MRPSFRKRLAAVLATTLGLAAGGLTLAPAAHAAEPPMPVNVIHHMVDYDYGDVGSFLATVSVPSWDGSAMVSSTTDGQGSTAVRDKIKITSVQTGASITHDYTNGCTLANPEPTAPFDVSSLLAGGTTQLQFELIHDCSGLFGTSEIDLTFGTATSPPPPPASKRAVFQGDSFSSGQGAPGPNGYIVGTDQKDNRCHRSVAAYGPRLGAEVLGSSYRTTFSACSGAVIADFYKSFGTNHKDAFGRPANPAEIPQLDHLTKDTTVVTVSVSGNDVNFSGVMTDCVVNVITRKTCEQRSGKAVSAAIDKIRRTKVLQKLYRDIKARVAINAQILVMPYPRFFPVNPPGRCDSGGPTPLYGSDMRWINDSIRALDDVIKQAAKEAGVTYVEAFNMLKGHELCTASPWMNKVRLPDLEGSFHPNQSGQDAYFRLARARVLS